MNVSFNEELACLYGDRPAIFLNNLIFWLRTHKFREENQNVTYERSHHLVVPDGTSLAGNVNCDGQTRYWTYNTLAEFQAHFPYWSLRRTRYILDELVNAGVVLKANFNSKAYDLTGWYALADESLLMPACAALDAPVAPVNPVPDAPVNLAPANPAATAQTPENRLRQTPAENGRPLPKTAAALQKSPCRLRQTPAENGRPIPNHNPDLKNHTSYDIATGQNKAGDTNESLAKDTAQSISEDAVATGQTHSQGKDKEQEPEAEPQIAKKAARFVVPTEEAVLAAFTAKGRADLAAEFYAYWSSVDWYRGRTRMVNWQASTSTWIAKAGPAPQTQTPRSAPPPKPQYELVYDDATGTFIKQRVSPAPVQDKD